MKAAGESAEYRPGSSVAKKAREKINNSADVARACDDLVAVDREHFVCFDLDARHCVIERRIVAIGSLIGVDVHPREVFKAAIINSAAAVIFAHNHPSGDPTPSAQDIELTTRLRQVGELLGIRVLDHVVIGSEGHVSIADRGWS
jgi:DNA repair protein RadC